MTDTMKSADTTSVVAEVTAWLADNWDPDLTVAEWWERLGLAGWAAPTLPTNAYGRGLTRNDAVQVQQAIADHGALPAPGGLGLMLAAPTIAQHGDQEQIERYVRDIVTGRRAWCQLFSEPAAGSDLAGLQCKAEQDGEEWIVNGQKVWTSGGHVADLGMLIARTDADVPKHQGITYFAIDMHQEGIEVRPLREMTGRSLFNEVFLDNAVVADEAMIGGKNNGWAVANSTLMFERASLGSGGGSAAASAATPGTVAGDLERRAGDYVGQRRRGGNSFGGMVSGLRDLAVATGAADDPTIRQDLMRLHTMAEIGRMNGMRVKAARLAGTDIPGMPNISKLSMSHMMRLQRDLGLRIVGASGMLHAYDSSDRKALDEATAIRSSVSSPSSPSSPKPRRSTAGPTRCSATSWVSVCSACRRSRTAIARCPSRSCRRTSEAGRVSDERAPRIGSIGLADLLTLEPHGPDTYVAPVARYPWGGRLFGGQVVAQALRAAAATVDPARPAHSLHSYFIRPGTTGEPVRFEVERLRDGRSFSTRQVVARQSAGAILNLSVSFQVTEDEATCRWCRSRTTCRGPTIPPHSIGRGGPCSSGERSNTTAVSATGSVSPTRFPTTRRPSLRAGLRLRFGTLPAGALAAPRCHRRPQRPWTLPGRQPGSRRLVPPPDRRAPVALVRLHDPRLVRGTGSRDR